MPSMKLTNAVCESFNKTWVTFEQCRLKAIRRNLTIFNVNGTFQYPTTKLYMTFEMQKKASGYKPWLVKHSFDICTNMLRTTHPISKVVMASLKKKTTINHPCPYVVSVSESYTK
ncbi:hypothetical protein KR044_001505 [Drosophila immigrans]|nr:hypothetical protein KR044_001505 [Drosophila immigrans]